MLNSIQQRVSAFLIASMCLSVGQLVAATPNASDLLKLIKSPLKKAAPPQPPTFPFSLDQATDYQHRYATWAGLPLEVTNRCGIRFRLIPPGTFQMGSPKEEPGHQQSAYDETLHQVRLTRAIYLSTRETTVAQFRRFVLDTSFLTDGEKNGGGNAHDSRAVWKHRPGTSWKEPGFAGPFRMRDDLPVVHVSHSDSIAFCEWLNQKGNLAGADWPTIRYDLPSEAEWEWSCRSGSAARFWWGGELDNTGKRLNVGDQSLKKTHPQWPRQVLPMDDGHAFPASVGSYQANGFGLHDMLGNVWEFCSTRYGSYDLARTTVDPGDLSSDRGFAVRGGGWSNQPNDSRCATRNADPPHFCHSNLGFRVAIRLPPLRVTPQQDAPISKRRVMPVDVSPPDTRLGPLATEHANFNLQPATDKATWKTRAAEIRREMRVSMGLWPWPKRTPLNAVIHGQVDRPEYTVERVFFESIPGHYVTGSLYRPKDDVNPNARDNGKRPAVLSPHGHFPGGRFQDAGIAAANRSIAAGAERFEDGGRSFMQARCVQLARIGCVVFLYDMVGYGDSQQLSEKMAHKFSGSRREFDAPPTGGFNSTRSEHWLVNPLGMHTWNAIRALDFLTSLDDVDDTRIAVTGGSGGGTQTFMLCALDDRPLVSVPVVIVSTARQGGCICENISHLRIGSNNMDYTALHAPKPLLLISADDATRTMNRRGSPELRRHYEAFAAESNVDHVSLLHFPHNYNAVSRAAMYSWLNRHLKLQVDEPILEQPFELLAKDEATVWTKTHPAPPAKANPDRDLVGDLVNASRDRIAEFQPTNEKSMAEYREVIGGAWQILLRGLPAEPNVRFNRLAVTDHETWSESRGLLQYDTIEGHHAAVPMIIVSPATRPKHSVIWLDAHGKSVLFQASGQLTANAQRLLDAGTQVIGLDLLGQGEFQANHKPVLRQRSLVGEEGFAAWTYCYNLPLFSRRVHDVLAAITWCRSQKREVALMALNGAGHVAAAAASQAGRSVSALAIDTQGFRFGALNDVFAADFLPGAKKYLDLPGVLSLIAPTKLWLRGEEHVPAVLRNAYQARGNLPDINHAVDKHDSDAIDWLNETFIRIP